jgi:hypothetical protein
VKTAAWSLAEAARPPLFASAPAAVAATHFGAEPRAGTAAMKPLRETFVKVKSSLNFCWTAWHGCDAFEIHEACGSTMVHPY